MEFKKGFYGALILLGLSTSSFSQSVLSLKQAVQTAKTNNLFLKTAHYNIGIAESDIISAKLRPNPALNNQSLILTNSNFYPKGTEVTSPRNRQVWWQLTKPIRLPNQRKYRIELAQQSVLFEQTNYAELQRNLAWEVSNQWLSTWVLKTKLDLYIEAQRNIDSLVKINELRLKNLVITQTDLVRTRLIAEQYNLQIRNERQSYFNELKRLKYLIGRPDSISLDSNDLAEPLPIQDLSLDSLMNMGLSLRTDVRRAKSAIDVSETNIRLQKAQAYPTPELGMIWNPQNTIPYLGFFGTVQVPLFSRNQGEIVKSQLVRKQAEQGLETLQQRIITEVLTSYQSYHTQRENLAKYQSILTQSEAVLNSVRYAYLKGGTTIVDFLEAQRTWFDTRQIYYDALISYRRSYIELLFSTGLINQLYE